ncbi:hypothetical protein RRG08_042444 [Elysia crispata]|uniref:Uncharacterized protein n=1 Tax=Elysia crispata TaxID=231223 RepID=A0AAE1DDM2_9GAST|nr:hypothetical protein RRG08_042444 [Elysia crispata]
MMLSLKKPFVVNLVTAMRVRSETSSSRLLLIVSFTPRFSFTNVPMFILKPCIEIKIACDSTLLNHALFPTEVGRRALIIAIGKILGEYYVQKVQGFGSCLRGIVK